MLSEVDGAERFTSKIPFHPELFTNVLDRNKEYKFKDIFGNPLKKVKFKSVWDSRNFVEKYAGSNMQIYGQQRHEYTYIAENYPNTIEYDISKLVIANMDIEVAATQGFPQPKYATEEVLSIAIKICNKMYVFACKDFEADNSNVTYVKCADEFELLESFLELWTGAYPDIITGYNCGFFDIPYLVNRIKGIFGEDVSNRLSPWGILLPKKVSYKGGFKQKDCYEILGISILDQMEMFIKFVPQPYESYSLNFVAHEELGEKKIDYSEYKSLDDLYNHDFDRFLRYNIQDVLLVEALGKKRKLIDMVVGIAYDAKVNFQDVFSQVRMWDVRICNHLKSKNIIIPPMKEQQEDVGYKGAFVKPPIIGRHRYLACFDLNSEYPMTMIQNNISPDTLLPGTRLFDPNKTDLLDPGFDNSKAVALEASIAANGFLFSNEHRGFLPEILNDMYNDRLKYQEKKSIYDQKLLLIEAELKRRHISMKDLEEN